jgi:hypothetical protein
MERVAARVWVLMAGTSKERLPATELARLRVDAGLSTAAAAESDE